MSPGEQETASLLRTDSSAPPCSAGLTRPPSSTASFVSCDQNHTAHPHAGPLFPGQPGSWESKPQPCCSWRGAPSRVQATLASPRACTQSLSAAAQPGAMQRAAWRDAPSGSRYLDSSGKAPTAFWSEELEKAGEERVRPRPPTHPGLREKAKGNAGPHARPGLLQPVAAGLPGATVGAGGSEGFCLGEQPGRAPPGERTASA